MSLSGNLFHRIGAADANARSPYEQVEEGGTTSKVFVRGMEVSLGCVWSNDISQVSCILMDYDFLAHKCHFEIF